MGNRTEDSKDPAGFCLSQSHETTDSTMNINQELTLRVENSDALNEDHLSDSQLEIMEQENREALSKIHLSTPVLPGDIVPANEALEIILLAAGIATDDTIQHKMREVVFFDKLYASPGKAPKPWQKRSFRQWCLNSRAAARGWDRILRTHSKYCLDDCRQ